MRFTTPYLQEQIKAGSSMYYALHFAPTVEQEALAALYSIHKAINLIPQQIKDQDIAKAKLAWWQTEIERLYTNDANHPATKILMAYSKQLPKALFEEMIAASLDTLQFNAFEKTNDLLLHCHRRHSSICLLSAYLTGFSEQSSLSFARDIGVFLRLVDVLLHLNNDLKAECFFIPLELLEEQALTPANFQQAPVATQTAIFSQIAELANAHYDKAQSSLASVDRKHQTPLLTMAALKQRQLALIARHNFPLLQHYLGLTPIRKFLLARKTAKKNQKFVTRAKNPA